MSDDQMKVGIDLEVHTRGEEEIKRLNAQLKTVEATAKSIAASMKTAAGINPAGRGQVRPNDPVKAARESLGIDRDRLRVLKMQFAYEDKMRKADEANAKRQTVEDRRRYELQSAFTNRMFRQAAQERARADQAEKVAQARRERDTERAGRKAIAFNTRMISQRAREEAAASREQARADLSRARADAYRQRQAEIVDRRADREESANRRDVVRYGRATAQHGHDAYSRIARPITTGAAVAAGAGALAARSGISARMETDTAETNLKIFSEQTTDQIKAARRGWLDAEAIKHGQSIAAGLNAYGEVLKSGIKSPAENTKMLLGAVSALELDLAQTTKLAGLIDRNYGSASSPAKLKSAINAIAIAAREDPTQAPEIVEGVKRGFGVLSMGNMSPEELAAFVSGGQSVGIQPGKAGTFIATLGKQLSSGANPFLDPKNRKELNFAARNLGFGNAKAMSEAFKTDSTGTILKVLEGLKASDPTKRTAIASALSGNQWNDEDLQIVNGLDGLKSTLKAIKDPANASFLDDAARKRQESWLGQWNSTRAIINRFWESFGAGFDEILTAFNKTFLDASSRFDFDRVTDIVRQGLAGVKDALGIREWREFFSGAFGGNLASVGAQVREFARGFTEGILSVVRVIRSVFGAFAGADASTETIGRWTGAIIALAAACVVAAPAITVLAGLASVVGALATAGLTAWSLLKAAGVVGSTVPKVPVGPGAGAAGGVLGRLFGRFGAGAAAMAGPSTSLSKGEQDRLHDRLGKWAKDRETNEQTNKQTAPWVDPPLRKSLNELKESVERNTLIQKQSADQEWRGLIHKSAVSAAGTATSLRNDLAGIGSGYRTNAMVGSVGTPPLSESSGGSYIGGGSGLSRRGILGGGGGSNPGGAEASSAPGRGSANHMSGQYGAPGSNLTTITTASGKRVTVHKAAAENFRGFINELEASGYNIHSLGGYNHRSIRGGSRLSQHAYGNAIDINPAQNPMGSRLVTDMPRNISDLAAKWGITWGGDWKRRPDAMHFEWNGRTIDQLKAGSNAPSPSQGGPAGGLTDVINRAAENARIDPRILHGIRAGESGHRADYDKNITAREESYGPFQLNRKGGLGAVFERKTGLDLKDPRTIPAQAEFVANHIRDKLKNNPAYNPRSEWYGYRGLTQPDPRWGNSGLVEGVKRDQQRAQDLGNGITSSGWKPAAAGAGLGTKTPLGQDTPVRAQNTQPIGGASPNSGSSSGTTFNAPITINGAGQDAASIANAVQRRIREEQNRRTTDVMPDYA